MYYEWNESMSVKIPSIDRQHQTLVGYINDLHDTLDKENCHAITDHILSKLINYATVHFLYEEMLFSTYNYTEAEEHKESHERFISTVEDFTKRFRAGDDKVPGELLAMLKSWLNNHILKEDMAYSEILVSMGAK